MTKDNTWNLSSFSDIINRQGEERWQKEKAFNDLIDKMVVVLDEHRPTWFANYDGGGYILELMRMTGDESNAITRYKRELVKSHLWLGVQIAIAAGVVIKPPEPTPEETFADLKDGDGS